MKVSLITVCYNAEAYLQHCIESVLAQDYPDIEYLIIDGASKDGTLDIIKQYESSIAYWESEPDEGLYHAMNKALAKVSGEVVGILNADDFYPRTTVISEVVAALRETGVDTLFGDLLYVKSEETDTVVRFYPGKDFEPHKFARGNMPPHPTFFVKRFLYEQYGSFDTQYKICADFDLMVRFLVKAKASFTYLPKVLVHMRAGGVSTRGLKSTLTINQEMLVACRKYGLNTHLLRIYSKYFTKIFQLVLRPKGKEAAEKTTPLEV